MKVIQKYCTGRSISRQFAYESSFAAAMVHEGEDNFIEDSKIEIIDGEIVGTKWMGIDDGETNVLF